MIRPHGRRWLALAGSLLLHGGVLGGLALTLSPWRPSSPQAPALEVELRAAPAGPVSSAASPLPPRVAPPRAPERAARPLPAGPANAVATTDKAETPTRGASTDVATEGAAGAVGGDEPAIAAPDAAEPAPPETLGAAAAAGAAPAHALPPRLELGFEVRYGLASGKQSLLWVNEGERYTLSSVAEASGLAGVFYRGRFVQVSRGRLTAQGLQPEEFWDQRGDKRSNTRFDASRLTLVPAHGAPRHFSYSGTAQDALSLFFQLALDAPASAGALSYTVFNGKKLRAYRYAVRGETVLETALGPLRTLHLERVGDVDGRFEAWLAVDRHYLPVRLLRHDEQGNAIELRVQTIAP